MPELDYAFLAEYASVTHNRLNVIGASYTEIVMPSFPGEHLLSVAGRVRAPVGTDSIEMRLVVVPPQNEYRLTLVNLLNAESSATVYNGKVGLLFSASGVMPIPTAGLYEVLIYLEDVQVRRLAFEAMPAST